MLEKTHNLLDALYAHIQSNIDAHNWKSCWVVWFVSFQAAHATMLLGGWWKKPEDEKQKRMREEDFDLIVKHYLGVYIH